MLPASVRPQAKQAPPATLELIPRLEYLLVLAEVELGCADQPVARLNALLETTHQRGMLCLETELAWCWAKSLGNWAMLPWRAVRCKPAWNWPQRCQVQQAIRELRLRSPGC